MSCLTSDSKHLLSLNTHFATETFIMPVNKRTRISPKLLDNQTPAIIVVGDNKIAKREKNKDDASKPLYLKRI